VDPTYQRAVDSGLGVAEVWNGNAYMTAIEKKISEVTVGLNLFLNRWHQHKLQFDLSRLSRQFAGDPNAVIDGDPSPITKAPDQEDLRLRAMVQLKF
jgi:hypothetical protein